MEPDTEPGMPLRDVMTYYGGIAVNLMIRPKGLSGQIRAIPSKAQAHRLLIAAALSGAADSVRCEKSSLDIETTRECLSHLGEDFPVFDCRESGSTLRFLLPVSMALKERAAFEMDEGLAGRPMKPLMKAMERRGCSFEMWGNSFTATGPMKSGTFILPGNVSSQYISGLLLACPLLEGDSKLKLTSELQSEPYVAMTQKVLEKYGIRVQRTDDEFVPEFFIPGRQRYLSPGPVTVEGDWSNAAFFIAAGALSGSLSCTGLDLQSVQGDKEIINVIRSFSGFITPSAGSVVTRVRDLFGTVLDVSDMPDLAPVIAVLAAGALSTTTIVGGRRLRLKESDRLHALAGNLLALGGDVEETEEGLIIRGTGRLRGGTVDGFGDHRIVMAMAIASILCREPVIIRGAEAVRKSYPGFFSDFKSLGGEVFTV